MGEHFSVDGWDKGEGLVSGGEGSIRFFHRKLRLFSQMGVRSQVDHFRLGLTAVVAEP